MYLTLSHLYQNPACPISGIEVRAMAHPVVIGGEPSVFELRHLLLARVQQGQQGALLSPCTRNPYSIRDIQPVRYEGRDMERYYSTIDILRHMGVAEDEEWVPAPEDPAWPPLSPDPRPIFVPDVDAGGDYDALPPLNARFQRLREQLNDQHIERYAQGLLKEVRERKRVRSMLEYLRLMLDHGPKPSADKPLSSAAHEFLYRAYDWELHRLGSDPPSNGLSSHLAARIPYDEALYFTEGIFGRGSPARPPVLFADLVESYPAFFNPFSATQDQAIAAIRYITGEEALRSPAHLDASFEGRALRGRLFYAAAEILSDICKRHVSAGELPLPPSDAEFDEARARIEHTLIVARFEMEGRNRDMPPAISAAQARLDLFRLAAGRRGVEPAAYLEAFDGASVDIYDTLLDRAPLRNLDAYRFDALGRSASVPPMTVLQANYDVSDALRELNGLAMERGLHLMGENPPRRSVFERFYHYHSTRLTAVLRAMPSDPTFPSRRGPFPGAGRAPVPIGALPSASEL
jgi:hypothetical protein